MSKLVWILGHDPSLECLDRGRWGGLPEFAQTALTVASDGCCWATKNLNRDHDRKIGVEDSSSITYDDKSLPVVSAGRSIWVMSVNTIVPGLIATQMLKDYDIIPSDTDKNGNPVPRLDLPRRRSVRQYHR